MLHFSLLHKGAVNVSTCLGVPSIIIVPPSCIINTGAKTTKKDIVVSSLVSKATLLVINHIGYSLCLVPNR